MLACLAYNLLLMSYPGLRPSSRRPSPVYVPRVFGFKVYSNPPAKSIEALEEGYKKDQQSAQTEKSAEPPVQGGAGQ